MEDSLEKKSDFCSLPNVPFFSQFSSKMFIKIEDDKWGRFHPFLLMAPHVSKGKSKRGHSILKGSMGLVIFTVDTYFWFMFMIYIYIYMVK